MSSSSVWGENEELPTLKSKGKFSLFGPTHFFNPFLLAPFLLGLRLTYSAKRATVSTRQRFFKLFCHFLIEGWGFSDSLKFTRERDLGLPRRS